ncbi:hypothetical protein HYFRA_00014022 [Hymenoscyphus fraxineus]|uniref:Secreted protein n=1 Tax=Hymenoscyphus fraxineus TaxID=746836 RepID=A0A9N9LEI2_9HELO|nr:hypothetical protein HYFRA_00014022 [Hymenoscyphus fraxineus]
MTTNLSFIVVLLVSPFMYVCGTNVDNVRKSMAYWDAILLFSPPNEKLYFVGGTALERSTWAALTVKRQTQESIPQSNGTVRDTMMCVIDVHLIRQEFRLVQSSKGNKCLAYGRRHARTPGPVSWGTVPDQTNRPESEGLKDSENQQRKTKQAHSPRPMEDYVKDNRRGLIYLRGLEMVFS